MTDADLAQARGLLSVVATPIGNLEDITLRAVSILRAADVVLAEDTRQTRKLLSHLGISTPLRALHEHSTDQQIARCAEELREGKHLALVTDAGTPLISDPGARLVQAASAQGTQVESIPGPSAVIAALSVCGVAFDAFTFVGFAPRTGSRRREWLERIAGNADASVFFESPQRIGATLAELAELLHEQRVLAVCRELTKLHEEVVRGSAHELAQRFAEGSRGEITVVVGSGEIKPASTAEEDAPSLDARITELLAQGVSARDAARRLARELGLPRRHVYARATGLAAPETETEAETEAEAEAEAESEAEAEAEADLRTGRSRSPTTAG